MQRRDFLRIGGLGLCGVSTLDLIRARAVASPSRTHPRRVRPAGPVYSAMEVSESDGWWICGSTRVRVDLDPAADDLVSVSEEAGADRVTSRSALLSAGSRALLALRDVGGTDRGRLEMAAPDLTSRLG